MTGNQTKGNESGAVVFHGTKKYSISKTADEKSSAVAGDKIMEPQQIIIIKKSDVRSQVLKVQDGAAVHSIGKSTNDVSRVEINPYDALKDADAIIKKSQNKNQVKIVGGAMSHSIGEATSEKFSPAVPVSSSSDVNGFKKADSKPGDIKMIKSAKKNIR